MSPMHLEVHTLGLSTGVRRGLYRQEKKPKAALRQPERQIRQAIPTNGKTRANSTSRLWFLNKEIEMEINQQKTVKVNAKTLRIHYHITLLPKPRLTICAGHLAAGCCDGEADTAHRRQYRAWRLKGSSIS